MPAGAGQAGASEQVAASLFICPPVHLWNQVRHAEQREGGLRRMQLLLPLPLGKRRFLKGGSEALRAKGCQRAGAESSVQGHAHALFPATKCRTDAAAAAAVAAGSNGGGRRRTPQASTTAVKGARATDTQCPPPSSCRWKAQPGCGSPLTLTAAACTRAARGQQEGAGRTCWVRRAREAALQTLAGRAVAC